MKCEPCGAEGEMNTCLTVNVSKMSGITMELFAVTKFYCVDCVESKGITEIVKQFVADVKKAHDFTPPSVTVLPVGDEDPEQMKREIDEWVQLSAGGLSSSYLSPV